MTQAVRLSDEQRRILLYLYDHHRDLAHHPLRRNFAAWGVPWRTAELTRSAQASVSRTLARLEARERCGAVRGLDAQEIGRHVFFQCLNPLTIGSLSEPIRI